MTAIPAMHQKSGVFLTREGALTAIRASSNIDENGLEAAVRAVVILGLVPRICCLSIRQVGIFGEWVKYSDLENRECFQ